MQSVLELTELAAKRDRVANLSVVLEEEDCRHSGTERPERAGSTGADPIPVAVGPETAGSTVADPVPFLSCGCERSHVDIAMPVISSAPEPQPQKDNFQGRYGLLHVHGS